MAITITDAQYNGSYHSNGHVRSRAVFNYSVASSTNTTVTLNVTVSLQVKTTAAGKVGISYNLSDPVVKFKIGSTVIDSIPAPSTWNSASAIPDVSITSANTWTQVTSLSKSITLNKTTSTQSLVIYQFKMPFVGKSTATSGYSTLDTWNSTDVAFYTVPVKSYTVSYNANGGTGAPASQTKVHGTSLTLTTAKPTRTNYVFKNWNTKSDGTGTAYSPGGTYSANAAATLYAQWYAPYTVTPNANGGTLKSGCSALTKVHNTALTLWSSSLNPTRSGYAFKRWNTSSNDTGTGYAAGAKYTANASATLYAIWNRTVTYNANGGTGAPSSQTGVNTSAMTLTTAKPTRSGYTFYKWNTKSDGTGTEYSSGGTYAAGNPSVTLYAIWKPLISTVTIGSAKAIRVDSASSTTEADEGEYAYITVPYTVSGPAAGNIAMTVTASAPSGATVPTVTIVSGTSTKAANVDKTGTFTARAATCAIDKRYTLDVTVTATNTTYTSQAAKSTTRTIVLPMAFFTMDVLAGGHGVAFGKPATRQALDIGMTTYVDAKTLTLQSSNIDRDGTDPASTVDGNSWLWLADSDGEIVGLVRPRRYADGRQTLILQSTNEASGGEAVNYLMLHIAKDGTRSYTVADPAAFRSAISAMPYYYVDHAGDDLNDQSAGECWWGNNMGNSPDGSTGYFLTFRISSLQISYKHLANGGEIHVWARNYMNSTWGAWTRLDSRLVSTATASSIITAASGITISGANYVERGGVATLNIGFKRTATTTGNFSIGTVVSGKRPAITIYGAITSAAITWVGVQSGGTVQAYADAATSASSTYYCSFTYVLA